MKFGRTSDARSGFFMGFGAQCAWCSSATSGPLIVEAVVGEHTLLLSEYDCRNELRIEDVPLWIRLIGHSSVRWIDYGVGFITLLKVGSYLNRFM